MLKRTVSLTAAILMLLSVIFCSPFSAAATAANTYVLPTPIVDVNNGNAIADINLANANTYGDIVIVSSNFTQELDPDEPRLSHTKFDYFTPNANLQKGQKIKREFYLLQPKDYNPAKSYPLLVSLPGLACFPADFEAFKSSVEAWKAYSETDEECFILVPNIDHIYYNNPIYPLAPDNPYHERTIEYAGAVGSGGDYDGDPSTSPFEEYPIRIQHRISDIMSLLGVLEAQYSFDSSRYYAVGMSLGSLFSWRLNAEYPNLFAAFIPMDGTLSDALVQVSRYRDYMPEDEGISIAKITNRMEAEFAGYKSALAYKPIYGLYAADQAPFFIYDTGNTGDGDPFRIAALAADAALPVTASSKIFKRSIFNISDNPALQHGNADALLTSEIVKWLFNQRLPAPSTLVKTQVETNLFEIDGISHTAENGVLYIGGRLNLPIRTIMFSTGLQHTLDYNLDTDTCTITVNDRLCRTSSIILQLNSSDITVNGVSYIGALLSPPSTVNGRFYVGIRDLGFALGYNTDYAASNGIETLTISPVYFGV
ncbi:MAG: hypothetical protein LBS74_01870 [Oscillospiraceae bacterium]|jgi:pimeloyl-ACP methyl ester carboxylesterase|nr:hypothetical protein [Oscillospiraceae bacterium]